MPDIVGQIDGALFGYEVSKDAMRWAPPGTTGSPTTSAKGPVYIREADGSLTLIGHRDGPPITVDAADVDQLRRGLERLGESVAEYVHAVGVAFGRFCENLRVALGQPALTAIFAKEIAAGRERHRAELSAMHREYARRQKARRRRRR